jgi:FAD/FMN-containing dehydrogenase
MLATQCQPLAALPGPRVCSALDLCKAVLAGSGPAHHAHAGGLDRTLCHDAVHGLLEVQAGASWRSFAAHTRGAFLPGTVGASIAANSAGPDGRPVVAHLRALTLVTADGELRRVSRDQAPELFQLAVGGFGAFGPFYSLTLDLATLSQSAADAAEAVCLGLAVAEAPGALHCLDLLVPPAASGQFVAQVRAALEERRCTLSRLEVRRVLREQETLLRWARRDYAALHIEFRTRETIGACVSAAELRSRLIDLAIDAGGAFAPDHLPHATRAQAEACYPMLGAFLAEKRRYDPAERVLGAWYRGVRESWRRQECEVRWSRG